MILFEEHATPRADEMQTHLSLLLLSSDLDSDALEWVSLIYRAHARLDTSLYARRSYKDKPSALPVSFGHRHIATVYVRDPHGAGTGMAGNAPPVYLVASYVGSTAREDDFFEALEIGAEPTEEECLYARQVMMENHLDVRDCVLVEAIYQVQTPDSWPEKKRAYFTELSRHDGDADTADRLIAGPFALWEDVAGYMMRNYAQEYTSLPVFYIPKGILVPAFAS